MVLDSLATGLKSNAENPVLKDHPPRPSVVCEEQRKTPARLCMIRTESAFLHVLAEGKVFFLSWACSPRRVGVIAVRLASAACALLRKRCSFCPCRARLPRPASALTQASGPLVTHPHPALSPLRLWLSSSSLIQSFFFFFPLLSLKELAKKQA